MSSRIAVCGQQPVRTATIRSSSSTPLGAGSRRPRSCRCRWSPRPGDISSRSSRHSAATSAVLPLPTGPPMPIRSARCGPWFVRVVARGRVPSVPLRCQDSNRRSSGLLVQFGDQVERGRGRPRAGRRRRTARAPPRAATASIRPARPASTRCTPSGSSPSSRTAADAGPVTDAVRRDPRRLRRRPARDGRPPRRARPDGAGRPATPGQGVEDGRRPGGRARPAAARGPGPARRSAARARACARRPPRRGAAQSPTASAGTPRRPARRRPGPAVASAAAQEVRPSVSRSRTTPGRGGRSRARPSGRGRRPGAASRRAGAAAASIRTGSSAGPSAGRTRARARPRRRRCVTVNVSGSTSMSGSASLSGMSALPSRRVSATGTSRAPYGEPVGEPVLERGRRDEVHRESRGAAVAPHIGRGSTGCGVGIEALASPICRPGDHAALEHQVRAHAEERRLPQHQVGELARLDRADLAVEAVRDRRADRVLGDVAAGPQVVVRGPPGAPRRPSSRARSARCG